MNRTPKAKKYDWDSVNKYYSEGHTYRETQEKFGFAARSWDNAVKRGDVIPRSNRVNPEDIINGKYQTKSRNSLKQQLIKHNVLPYECAICNNEGTWMNKTLSLQLDHINGINNDDRLENLRFLCPNCHAQTETFAGKSKGKGTYNRHKNNKSSF